MQLGEGLGRITSVTPRIVELSTKTFIGDAISVEVVVRRLREKLPKLWKLSSLLERGIEFSGTGSSAADAAVGLLSLRRGDSDDSSLSLSGCWRLEGLAIKSWGRGTRRCERCQVSRGDGTRRGERCQVSREGQALVWSGGWSGRTGVVGGWGPPPSPSSFQLTLSCSVIASSCRCTSQPAPRGGT